MNHTTTVHAGLVLKDELEERGISQTQLARHIGVLPKTINEICGGKRGISAAMAVQLSRALGASPAYWPLDFPSLPSFTAAMCVACPKASTGAVARPVFPGVKS